MSRITPQQREWIDSLECVRLSSSEAHQDLIYSFSSSKYEYLESKLCDQGYDKDKDGKEAYYIVRQKDSSEILMYFTLRAGMLYESVPDPKCISLCEEYCDNTKRKSGYNDRIRDFQIDNNLSDKDLDSYMSQLYSETRALQKKRRQESKMVQSKDVVLVDKIFPAIEIAAFCKNSSCESYSAKEFGHHKIGEIVFWFKILPIVFRCRELIGLEYIYLFAANDTEDELLSNYYQIRLNFKSHSNIGVLKPTENSGCRFHYQRLTEASEQIKLIEEQFNPDPDASY